MTQQSTVVGLNIRQEANSRSAKLGVLPGGARIEVGERSANRKWARIARMIEGEIAPVRAGDPVDPAAATGWVFLGELDPDTTSEPDAFDSVVVLAEPRPIHAGTLVGHLGEYQQYEDAMPVPERGKRPLLHLEVLSGDDVPAFIERCRAYAQTLPEGSRTLLVIEIGAKLVQPSAPDVTLGAGQRVVPTAAQRGSGRWVKVRPGEVRLVERTALGTYQQSTNTYSTGEIWTGWYVGDTDDQRTQDRRVGQSYSHREVIVPNGEDVWVERGSLGEGGALPAGGLSGWSAFPLQVKNASAPEAEHLYVLSRSELEATGDADRAVDPEGNKWWRVAVGSGGGWVCERGHDKVSMQSPWAWPGFEFVSEGEIRPVDLLSRSFLRSGVAFPHEQGDFKARADKVEDSALVERVYEQIDRDGDGNLDAQELRAAMQQPPLARSLSRIIAHYESEWGGEMTKWDELDPLMLDGVPEWQVEKQRIGALRFWPEMAGKVEGFPSDPTVHHIHPIALIANFIGGSLTLEEARVRAFLRMLRVGEGTVGVAGYERLYGGSSFIRDHGRTFADHPRISITAGRYTSTAAGAYQVMGYTWDDAGQVGFRARYGIPDFTPRSQDRYGVVLIKHKRSALEDVKRGDIRAAIDRCNEEWASLPGSRYGQPTVTWDQALRHFDEYLEQELSGESDLAIRPGEIDDILY